VTLVGPYLPPLPGAPSDPAETGEAIELDFDLNLHTVNVDLERGTFRTLNLVSFGVPAHVLHAQPGRPLRSRAQSARSTW